MNLGNTKLEIKDIDYGKKLAKLSSTKNGIRIVPLTDEHQFVYGIVLE